MEKLLKDWRQDAINKHQYESAIFIGDKLLALTSKCPSSVLFDILMLTRRPKGCLLACPSPLLHGQLHTCSELPLET